MRYKIKTFNTETEASNLISQIEGLINDTYGEPLYSTTLIKWGVIIDDYYREIITSIIGQSDYDSLPQLEGHNPDWFEVKN